MEFRKCYLGATELARWFGHGGGVINQYLLDEWKDTGKLRVNIAPMGAMSYHLGDAIDLMNEHFPAKNVVVYSNVKGVADVVERFKTARDVFQCSTAEHRYDISPNKELVNVDEYCRVVQLVCSGRICEIIVSSNDPLPVVYLTKEELKAFEQSNVMISTPDKIPSNSADFYCNGKSVYVSCPSRFNNESSETKSAQPPTQPATQNSTLPKYATYKELNITVSQETVTMWVSEGKVKAISYGNKTLYSVDDINKQIPVEKVVVGYMRTSCKPFHYMANEYGIQLTDLYIDHEDGQKFLQLMLDRAKRGHISRVVIGCVQDLRSFDILLQLEECGVEVLFINRD